MTYRRWLGLVLAGLLLVLSGAFGQAQRASIAQAQVSAGTFVGQLSGLDAFVGINSDGFTVTAYLCDGANTTLADDFQGTIDQASSGVLVLQAVSGDLLQINADATTLPGLLVPEGSLTGALITTDGTAYPFTTEAARGAAGLYLGAPQTLPDGSVGEGGWVVLNDGEVRGQVSLGPPNSQQATAYGQSGSLSG